MGPGFESLKVHQLASQHPIVDLRSRIFEHQHTMVMCREKRERIARKNKKLCDKITEFFISFHFLRQMVIKNRTKSNETRRLEHIVIDVL